MQLLPERLKKVYDSAPAPAWYVGIVDVAPASAAPVGKAAPRVRVSRRKDAW